MTREVNRPQLVCWDYDGLIVDTEWVEYECWRDALAAVDVPLAMDDYQRLAGTRQTGRKVLELVRRQGFEAPLRQVVEDVRARYQSAVAALPPRDGLEPLLERSRASDLLNWVVSSSDSEQIAGTLARLGLGRFFDGIIGGDTVLEHKPAPDPYLAALTRTGIPGVRARVLEDSAVGVRAARSAGLPVIAVVNEVTACHDFPAGVAVVSSLSEVPLEWLLGESHDRHG